MHEELPQPDDADNVTDAPKDDDNDESENEDVLGGLED